MITWLYNRFGHIQIYQGEVGYRHIMNNDCDVLLQSEDDVKQFFYDIGFDYDGVHVNDWGLSIDLGYFN
jgi:hypothetical protein